MKTVVTHTGSSEINKKLTHWVQLRETTFHPKGGGQPSDKGTISGVEVSCVHKERSAPEIYHCFENAPPFKIGDEAILEVDAETRHLHSRLHSAGHVLAEAIQKHFPQLQAYQGNHYPDSSYVRFKTSGPVQDKQIIKLQAEAEFKTWIDQDLKVEERLEPSGFRLVKVYQD